MAPISRINALKGYNFDKPIMISTHPLPSDWFKNLHLYIAKYLELTPEQTKKLEKKLDDKLGAASTYSFKNTLLDELAAVFRRLNDEKIDVSEKHSIASICSEGVANCTEGFHDRVMSIVQSFNIPNTLDALLTRMRTYIVDQSARQLTNEVHAHNHVYTIAKSSGYGVALLNKYDPYNGNLTDEKIVKQLSTNFEKEYHLHGILNNLILQIKDILTSEYNYKGSNNSEEGYVFSDTSKFLTYLEKIFDNKIEDSSNFFLLNENSCIYDLNWSTINRELLKTLIRLNYINLNKDEEKAIQQLFLESEAEESSSDEINLNPLFENNLIYNIELLYYILSCLEQSQVTLKNNLIIHYLKKLKTVSEQCTALQNLIKLYPKENTLDLSALSSHSILTDYLSTTLLLMLYIRIHSTELWRLFSSRFLFLNENDKTLFVTNYILFLANNNHWEIVTWIVLNNPINAVNNNDYVNPFVLAVQKNQVEAVDAFIKMNTLSCSMPNVMILHNAFIYPELLKKLLSKENIHQELIQNALISLNSQGVTPIVYAAEQKKWDIVTWIASNISTDLNDEANYKKALLVAVQANQIEAIDALINANTLSCLRAENTLLHSAIEHPELLKRLLSKENIQQPMIQSAMKSSNTKEITPIVYAAEQKKWDIVIWIASNISTDENDGADYKKALLVAVQANQIEAVDALIKANTLSCCNAESNLFFSAVKYPEILERLLSKENIHQPMIQNALTFNQEKTPIVAMTLQKQWKTVIWIASQTSTDIHDKMDYASALLLAIEANETEAVDALIKANALSSTNRNWLRYTDVLNTILKEKNAKTIEQLNTLLRSSQHLETYHSQNPILLAAQNNFWEVVKWYVSQHMDRPFNVANDIKTLRIAVRENQTEAVQLLIKAKALSSNEIYHVDEHGLTILDYALGSLSFKKGLKYSYLTNYDEDSITTYRENKIKLRLLDILISKDTVNEFQIKKALTYTDRNKFTFIVKAAREGEWDAVTRIASHCSTDSYDRMQFAAALAQAVFQNKMEVVSLLIQAKALSSIYLPWCQGDSGNTMLHGAINNTLLLKVLVSESTRDEPQIQFGLIFPNYKGETPIVTAAKEGKWEAVIIIASHHSTDKSDKKQFAKALILAIKANQTDAIHALICANSLEGLPPNYYKKDSVKGALKLLNQESNTPIVTAAKQQKWGVVSWIASHYTVNLSDSKQFRPALELAIQANNSTAVSALVQGITKRIIHAGCLGVLGYMSWGGLFKSKQPPKEKPSPLSLSTTCSKK